jgi:prepilin-type N-terminal cleavage/methylation domain-containing protein
MLLTVTAAWVPNGAGVERLMVVDGRTNTRNRARRGGVTLIELLVVSSLIGMLTAVMVPSLKGAREQARRTVCLSNLKHHSAGLFTYAEYHRELGPPIMKPLSGRSNRSFIQRKRNDGTVLQHLGRLWPDYVADAHVFRCPSSKTLDAGGKLSDLGSPYPPPVAGSYTYAVHMPAFKSPHVGASRHLAMASDNFTQWRISQNGHGYYAHRVGYNVLFTDGSATWYSDPDMSIALRRARWDDERDDFTYESIYDPNAEIPVDSYGSDMDIFRVWFSFCYNRQDPF